MDEPSATAAGRKRWRRSAGAAGLVGAGLVAGGILAGSQIAGAASRSSSTGRTANTAAASHRMTAGNPATMTHGPGETLLTGGTAEKVTAAAEKAEPGATIIRVETDAQGAAYEAHMRKADGTYVTVKLDTNFNVTGTDRGFGGPGDGPPGGWSSR